MLDDKELIRRALMGDQEAQAQCTEKGIVLPCPFCGNEKPIISTREICRVWCPNCLAKAAGMFTQQGALAEWNTRPSPPVGRCGECKYFNHFFNAVGHCMIHSQEKDSFGDGYRVEMLKTDFCSYFSPREE